MTSSTLIRAILARIDGQLSAGSPEVALTALDAAILAGQVSWLEAERGSPVTVTVGGGIMIAPAITFADVLDVIDMQLLSPLSPEVVLPRDHAQLLAALLTDLLNPREHACPGTRAPEAHTQPQRSTS